MTGQTWRAPVLELEELASHVRDWQSGGETVAHCHGRFDPLHIGHVLHFEEARNLADRLIVTITPDQFADKEPGRPLIPHDQRALMAACIRSVDAVGINRWPGAVELLQMLCPDIYVKGKDYQSNVNLDFIAEAEVAKNIGSSVHITKTIKYSSTNLIQDINRKA